MAVLVAQRDQLSICGKQARELRDIKIENIEISFAPRLHAVNPGIQRQQFRLLTGPIVSG